MPQKNTIPSILSKFENNPEKLFNMRLLIAVACAVLLLFASCKKSIPAEAQQTVLEQYFEQNILNRDFTVHYAVDNSSDLTAQYNGYLFKLLKSTLLNGPMTATKGAVTYNGSWSCNDDYSKLVITLPIAPSEFNFLTREWKFTKKAVPIMELAPWGSLEPKVLHMERQ
jgi:hypothetical protein